MPDSIHSTQMTTIVPMRGRMSPAEYDAERAKLRELYGDSSSEAAAKRDQAFALLFYRSGWTQEDLSKREHKSRIWIQYRLRFGRFLNFVTTVTNPELMPPKFTERAFRKLWEQTDKKELNERVRFGQIVELIKEQLALRQPQRKKIGAAIVKEFGDGHWHKVETIAEHVGTNVDHVMSTLETMRKLESYGGRSERKQVGTSYQFRIFKTDTVIPLGEIIEKLGPIIKNLQVEGRKNMATMSPGTVAVLANKLVKQLEEWAGERVTLGTTARRSSSPVPKEEASNGRSLDDNRTVGTPDISVD